MAVLVWETVRGRRVVAVDRGVLLVGRDAASDVRLDHVSVSRRHALIESDGRSARVTDLGSKAGTRINGARITAEIPSTLEPGDFVHFGEVMITLLKTPPPEAKAAAPRAPSRQRARRPRAAAPPTLLWAGGSGLLLVAAAALFFIFAGGPSDSPEERPIAASPREEKPAPPPPPPRAAEEPDPVPEPVDEPPPEPEMPRAEAGALPPEGWAEVESFPLLLELADATFRPVRLHRLRRTAVECVGGDGRLYAVDRNRITRLIERDFLERLARRRLEETPPADLEGRLALARWCAQRQVRGAGLAAAQAVLVQEPGHAEARALQRRLGGDAR